MALCAEVPGDFPDDLARPRPLAVVQAITPLAFYETVMVKVYGTLVDSGTRVEVNAGMIAAARL